MWHAWERREVYKVSVGKPEGKRPLGRSRRRWEDGIRMDLRETGLGGVDWIRLAQDRDRWWVVVSAVMNLRVLAPRSESVKREGSITDCRTFWPVKCLSRSLEASQLCDSTE
jgi:hypothetical protein